MRGIAIALGCLLTAAIGAQEPAAVTSAEVLAKVQSALDIESFPKDHKGLEAVGTTRHLGLNEDCSLVIDGRGRFRFHRPGVLGELRTFDGETAWIIDWSRTTRPLELRDRDMSISSSWLATGFWTVRPDLHEIELLPEQSSEREWALKVQRKDSKFPVTVFVDRVTHLPVRAAAKVRDQEHEWVFTDYAAAPGLRMPRSWTHTASGVASKVQFASVGKVQRDVEYTLTPQRTQRASFDSSKPGSLEIKKALSGHLLVKPTLSGEAVGWFILDSGAGHMCIDKALAEKLRLEAFGEVPVGGVGATIKGRFCKAPSFELGPVTLREPTFVELDLAQIGRLMGEEITGIVGYPFWQATVAELDCFAPRIELHEPNNYALPQPGKWQRLIIDSNHPIVEAKYEGDRTGWFKLDTGAANFLAFHTPAVRRHQLLEKRQTMPTMLGGVGGMIRARAGKIDWFELAGYRFERPNVVFSQADQGALADEYTDGNLGQQVLRPFTVIFNYGAGQIAFLPRTNTEPKQANHDADDTAP